ncbi:MAG: hypothetical protein HZA93_25300 [Verrucomicrobia bacterium]|nr:hypothetical protein [Verrucomicrobiota bacterium]
MTFFSALLVFALVLPAGCQTGGKSDHTPTVARFFLESRDTRSAAVTLPKSGIQLHLAATPAITEGDIVNVEVAQVELGRCLLFELTPAAARDLYRFSVVNQGGRLVLLVNGAAFGARRIDGAIADGRVFVFVEVPDETLPALAKNLKLTSAEIQRAVKKK